MNPLVKVNHIPWKYVIGMNLSLLVLAGTFLSLQPALESTDNRPRARDVQPTPELHSQIDPSRPPELLTPNPDWAKVGDAIVIKGKNLGTIPVGVLKIGGVTIPTSHIVDWSPEQIVFTVPEDSTSGSVSLTLVLPGGEIHTTTAQPLTITAVNP